MVSVMGSDLTPDPATLRALADQIARRQNDDYTSGYDRAIDLLCKAEPILLEELDALRTERDERAAIVDRYATAARVIALHLSAFCDESLPYDEMIADASRRAADALREARTALEAAIATIREWHGMGMGAAEEQAWALYQSSPEMRRLNAALAALPTTDTEPTDGQ